nr:ATP-binding protein [Actinomycetota bacterium]
ARLWRLGRGQPSVTRRRMRLMALGSLVLNIGLLAAAAAGSSSTDTRADVEVVSQVLGFVSAGLFYLGFEPPGFLRFLWRQPDIVPLREAEAALMSAVSTADVADVVLPYATRLLGGKGAVLVDREGQVAALHTLDEEEALAIGALVAGETGDEPIDRHNLLAVPVRRFWLGVQSSRYTPFFGRDELELLRGLAFLSGLALDRAHLFEQERASRLRAEQANEELETFVYSVSHDLKSPLVSLVGFLDCMRHDLGEVDGDMRFYLDRMDAGVEYMEALIQDLLELSRIGRVERDLADVDLGRVVGEVVDELLPFSPEAAVTVGDLPVLSMSTLRARQLFTNLVGNALVHSGRSDVHVHVSAVGLPDGGMRVVVADDGKGIPVEYREKVFRVFERLERTTSASGTGIGLAVCRKIVEQAGGVIHIADTPVGTAFEMDFPAALLRGPGARLEAVR